MEQLNVCTLEKFLEVDFPKPDPICLGIINRGEFIILSSTAKTGKSKIAMSLAFAVSKEALFLNFYPTVANNVLYLQTEISNGEFQKRIKASGFLKSDNDAEIFLSNDRIRLDDPRTFVMLEKMIDEKNISLMILDPFYTLHNKDENQQVEIGKVLTDISSLARRKNIGIMLIHHQGKKFEGSESTRPSHQHRGSSAFGDVPDGSLSLRKIDKVRLVLSFEFRNRESPDPVELVQENLGFKIIGTVHENSVDDKYALLISLISKRTEVTKADIVGWCDFHKIGGERTAQSLLARGIHEGKLTKRKLNKISLYSFTGKNAEPI